MDGLKFKAGFAVFAVMMIASSSATAQMSEDEFQALLDSQKKDEENVNDAEEEKESDEVVVESIDLPELFRSIDNPQARLQHLEDMVNIAQLEREYRELTGKAPEGALTLDEGRNSSATEGGQLEVMLRNEINSLKKQIEDMVITMNDKSSQEAYSEEVVTAIDSYKISDMWEVKGISIYGEERSAVITGGNGNNFVVRQGDDVGGVSVLSISSDSVQVREDGDQKNLPLAGTGYSGGNEFHMSSGVIVGDSWDNQTGYESSDYAGRRITYPQVTDSTSR